MKGWSAVLLVLLLAAVACGGEQGGGTRTKAAPDLASTLPAAEKVDWVRFGFSPDRNGVNPHEKLIDRKSVGRLRRIWRAKLPDVADSSPVLLHGVRASGKERDVLYATLENGSLVALDAASGRRLWLRRTSGPKITTSSPVADPARSLVFSYGLDGRIHRYRAASGKEIEGNGWPAPVTRMPETEKGSSALNVADGWVYATTSGYLGDAPPYQGHVVAVSERTGEEHVYNSLCAGLRHLLSNGECDSQRSGIWGRGGAVVDPTDGSLYATSGNGPYAPSRGDYADSVLRLSAPGLRLVDSYTPENYRKLEAQDLDLASASPAVLPRIPRSRTPYLLVQGGKDGKLRLISRGNMSGGGGPGHVGGALQTIRSAGCATFTQPVVWRNGGRLRVIVAGTCGMASYRVATDAGGRTRLRLEWKKDYRTTTPVVAGGVLFAASDGDLLALDPTSGRLLWSSERKGAGGTIGDIHWESPIVANGRVYVSDESGAMSAYGLPRGK